MIRGVIFDLDGVLVSTDELHYQSWRQLADAEDIPFDRTINHRLRGVSRMRSLEIILERSDRTHDDGRKQAMSDRKNAAFLTLLNDLTPRDMLPGAAACIETLKGRAVRIAVASSSRNARRILERLGLDATFNAVVDGNDIAESKPHPEVFEKAARLLDLPATDCLVIEDAPAGIEAARRAGMCVFGIGEPDVLPGVTNIATGLDRVTVDELLNLGET